METEKEYLLSGIIKKRSELVAALCAAYEQRTDVDPQKAILVERKIDNGTEWFFREIVEWDNPVMRSSTKCKAGHVTLVSNQYCPLCVDEQTTNLKTLYAGALEIIRVTQFGYYKVQTGVCIFCEKLQTEGHKEDCPQGRFLESVK